MLKYQLNDPGEYCVLCHIHKMLAHQASHSQKAYEVWSIHLKLSIFLMVKVFHMLSGHFLQMRRTANQICNSDPSRRFGMDELNFDYQLMNKFSYRFFLHRTSLPSTDGCCGRRTKKEYRTTNKEVYIFIEE